MDIIIVPHKYNVTETLARRLKSKAKKLETGEHFIGKIKVLISDPCFDGHDYRYCIVLGGVNNGNASK